MSWGLGRSAVVTVDQVCSSASNSLVMVAIAQQATPHEFAALATLFVIVTAALGFNRASLGTPLLLLSAKGLGAIRAETGYAGTWAAVVSVPIIGGVLTGAWLLDVLAPGVLLAVGVVLVLTQDVLRIAAIAADRPMRALFSDGVWMGMIAAVVVCGVLGVDLSAVQVIGVWIVGAFLAVALLLPESGAGPRRRIVAWFGTYWADRLRLGIFGCVDQLAVLAIVAVVAVTIGSGAVAAMRGASTLFGPLAMLLSAVPLLFIPHAQRSNATPRAQWRKLSRGAILGSVIAMVFGWFAMIMPITWGAMIFGDTWVYVSQIVGIIGIEYAAIVWIACAYSVLQSRGRSRDVLRIKVVQVSVQIGACIVAGVVVGSVTAIAWALTATAILTAVWSSYVARAVPGRVVNGGDGEAGTVAGPDNSKYFSDDRTGCAVRVGSKELT